MHKLLEQRLSVYREIGPVKVNRVDEAGGEIMWQVQQTTGKQEVLVCLSDLVVPHPRQWCEAIAPAINEQVLKAQLRAAEPEGG